VRSSKQLSEHCCKHRMLATAAPEVQSPRGRSAVLTCWHDSEHAQHLLAYHMASVRLT
jgi:hypothetical protein